jgi:hypothetical protein
MYFTANDESGFYMVDTTGKTEIGALNATPALSDTAYHDYRLVRSGTTVTAYIDGVEYMALTDDALGTEGGIGMGSYNDIALFDDYEEGAGGGTGVTDQLHQTRFNVYPNPAGDVLYIKAESDIQNLLISNIIGQEIKILNDVGSGSVELDVSGFDTGIYFLTVQGSKGSPATQKFIKK